MNGRVILSTVFISFIISLTSTVSAATYSGKGLFLFGDSATSLGRGGTGVSGLGTDLFYLNPAALSTAERFGLSLNYGTLGGSYYNPDITAAFPTAWGTLGGSFRMVYMDPGVDLAKGYALSLGVGKDLTPKVLVGISAEVLFGSSADSSTLAWTGITIGGIYRFEGMKKSRGFGFFEPRLGFSIKAGLPLGDHMSHADFNTITLGYNFIFFRHKNFDLSWYNDFTLVNYYKGYPVKLGLESLILDMVSVRFGTVIFNDDYGYGTFTAGAGYHFKKQTFAGSVNYALSWHNDSSHVHYLGVSFEYGTLDREAPKTLVSPDTKYLSPNHDGTQDYVMFNLKVEDRSRIKGWKLQIISPDKKVVREYRVSERDIIRGLSFRGFFRRLFSRKTSMDVPRTIMWDGTDDKGNTVPDATYRYTFTAWDERDNIAAKKTGTVTVDNTPPKVALKTDEALFSPNGDNQKDEFIIAQNITSSPDDSWKAGFKNAQGKVVKSYTWNGDAIPRQVKWDGKDDNGNDVPEGLYFYFISTKDRAGNSAAATVKEITLTRKYEIADIRLQKPWLTYLHDREFSFFPKLSKTEGLEEYTITILDEKEKPVKTITGGSPLPGVITWKGKDNEGEKLDDGIYHVRFTTRFKSGNTPSSFKKKLIVDSTPPEVTAKTSPDYFSPDGDEENDILTITTDVEEKFTVKKWKIEIRNPSGILFKIFSGTGNAPKEIKWDGLGDNKDIVESAVDYTMVVTVEDGAGNITVSDEKKIHIDILVVVTERGLKMRISNIQFAFGSSRLKKQGRKILDRVIVILGRYRRYDVIIEGHTDDIGPEEVNLKLSEKRAKAVNDYLQKNGVSKDRLQFVGMGETTPLYPNKNTENRRRNRRVEFLLIKKNG